VIENVSKAWKGLETEEESSNKTSSEKSKTTLSFKFLKFNNPNPKGSSFASFLRVGIIGGV
jgi:hypothetical protein